MRQNKNRRGFIKKSALAAIGLTLPFSDLKAFQVNSISGIESKVKIVRNGRIISLSMPIPQNISNVEIRLHSIANKSIFEYSDVSPYAPSAEDMQTGAVFDPEWQKIEEENIKANKELYFPVVDLVLEHDMEAVVEMDIKEEGTFCFNGNFWPERKIIESKIRIPSNKVEQWDNAILLEPKSNSISKFYVTKKVNVSDSIVTFQFETLRDDWDGEIEIFDVSNDSIVENELIQSDAKELNFTTGEGVSRARMEKSLAWATKYIVNCKNTNSSSPTYGGHFILYDLDAKTRLRSDWPWSWGPSSRMLINNSYIKNVDFGESSNDLLNEAVQIGMASLRQQILDSSHPAYGLIQATIEPGTLRDCGFDNRATGADTLFLVGWGWMPLFKATKNAAFLDASIRVAEAVGRLMDDHDDKMIPQAYNLKKKKWDDNMFFETSMGMVGLAELYKETGLEKHKEIMARFINMLLSAFEREDGLWDAMLYKRTGKIQSSNYFTKSFGYCVDGLLAAHEADPNQNYLEKALKISEHVVKGQAEDGSWSVRLDRSSKDVGVSDKATALWAYLFIRLYKATNDKMYLKSGEKALEWCMNNQYFGEDTVAHGGIVGRSWPSGIIYRHWFDMITTYTVSFFGIALQEALSLDDW
ncbi:hypothetical protein [Maribacter litoralis]|uniref:hypothetical protein n=1 Tax=Maribacter litoralis TaxID=2059726 RepID=UPI003F5CCA85